MKKPRKVYPYGLNNLTSDDFETALDIDLIGVTFPSLKRVQLRQSKGTRQQRINQVSGNNFLHVLHQNLINNLRNTMSFIRVTIASSNKKSLKEIAT